MFDRNLWCEIFARTDLPKWPCPRCQLGRLVTEPGSLKVLEPQYSKAACATPDWEPGWEDERFSLTMKCDEAACGEFVEAIGDTTVVEDVGNNGEWSLLSVLRPKAMFPAPPIIVIPESTPTDVQVNVKRAFSLLWSDMDAAANRLRVSVEALLDHFSVPKQRQSKKGKLVALDLNGRIAAFNKASPEQAETLTALRMIGNLGSHGTGVTREALLDAFEVYEDCLRDLVGEHRQRMENLRKKLIAAKGKYVL